MKLKSLLVCLGLLLSATSAMADATLAVGNATYSAGNTVTVPVTLTKNGANISIVSLDINYDASKLSNPVGIVGPAASAVGKAFYSNGTFNPPQPGKFRILIAGGMTVNPNDPVKGGTMTDVTPGGTSSVLNDGVVALVTFTALGSATGTITLGNVADAADPSANPVIINGTAGTLTPGSPTCNKATSSNLQKAINVVLEIDPFVPGMCADFDNNGSVTSSDIAKIIAAILAS